MAEYYRVAILEEKKVYELGTKHAAKDTFPLLLNEVVKNKTFVLYGDETHCFLEDRYEDNEGFAKIEFDSYTLDKQEWVENNGYSRDEFDTIFEELGGDELTVQDIIDFKNKNFH